MNELTLDDLRNKYRDIPQTSNSQNEVVSASTKPEVEVAPVTTVTPVSPIKVAPVSSNPIFAFLIFAGVGLFGGLYIVTTKSIATNTYNQQVLGAKTEKVIEEDDSSVEDKLDELSKKYNTGSKDPVISSTKKLSKDDLVANTEEPVVADEPADDDFAIEEDDAPVDDDTAVVEETVLKKYVVVLPNEAGWLNLRKEPLLGDAYVATRAEIGSEFSYISENEAWIQIEYTDGSLYWVAANLVDVIEK